MTIEQQSIETTEALKAPFPWFGGKSKVAHLVWQRFGNVPNYVEPFAGSLAVLLGRESAPRVVGPSVTHKIGLTGVFLDPPYDLRVVSNKEVTGRDGASTAALSLESF